MANENEKFLYEKAIDGRHHHQENFNHWMSMYSIFNGALFAGYYTIDEKTSLVTIALLLLGCFAGWAWYFSAIGFHDWIISWITVVKKHEEKLGGVVYRAYEGKKTISTQKLTKFFSLMVAIVWTVISAKTVSWRLKHVFGLSNSSRFCLFILTIGVILLCVCLLYFMSLETDFKKEPID